MAQKLARVGFHMGVIPDTASPPLPIHTHTEYLQDKITTKLRGPLHPVRGVFIAENVPIYPKIGAKKGVLTMTPVFDEKQRTYQSITSQPPYLQC